MVGKVPNTTTVREILWDGATIDIDYADARAGLTQVAGAVSRWTPEQGERQIRHALQHLDWRHRFVGALRRNGRSSRCTEDRL